MFGELTASGYLHNKSFYTKEFENLLGKIVACYKLMVNNNVSLSNNENKIRDELLLKYLKNDKTRQELGLSDFLFDREVPEDNTNGRTDIKIQTLNTFTQTEAYYILECKRLDNKKLRDKTGLNNKYIKEGIFRFTSNQYSSYHRVNGMIGFVVGDIDIHANIENLNHLLTQCSDITTTGHINKSNFIDDFEYHYNSTHQDTEKKELKLYHLMFDFSKNMLS